MFFSVGPTLHSKRLARATTLAVVAVLAVLAGPSAIAAAQAPALQIEQPVAGSRTNVQTPTFAGQTDDLSDPVTLNVYAGATATGTPTQTLILLFPTIGGSWGGTLEEPLAQGLYTAQAEQTNSESETGQSPPVDFTVDTAAPVVSIDSVAELINDPTPTLTGEAGTAEGDLAAVTVTVHKGSTLAGAVVEEAAASVSGSEWSYTTGHLADGTYTAQAAQSDEAGNTGLSGAVTFTVDTVAPDVSIDTPATPTNNPKPTLEGGAGTLAGDLEAVTVTVHKGSTLGGAVVEEVSASVSGAEWSHTTGTLLDGTYTAQAEQKDAAGNTGVSGPVTFTVDTEAPSVSLTVAEWTHDTTPSMEGTLGTAPGDVGAVTVAVHKGTLGGPLAQEASASVSGSKWSFTTTTLPEGTYVVEATQQDTAGNTGIGGPATFTVDTHAPVVSLNQPASPGNDSTPTLGGGGGTAPGDIATVTVRVYAGKTPTGTPVVTQGGVSVTGGVWSFTTPTLSDGTYTAQVTQSDKAANTGTSTARTFVIDTVKPALTITSPGAKEKLHVSRPTFAGAGGTVGGESPDSSTVKLKIYEGSVASGVPVDTFTEEVVSGKWTSGSTGPSLPDETYTVQAEQSDAAGNVTRVTVTFTIVTNSPVVTLNVGGLSSREGQPWPMSGPTPSFSGTAGNEPEDSGTVTVKIYEGSAATGEPVQEASVARVGSTWAATPVEPLPDGTYTVQAEQDTSIFGGTTGISPATTFTVDADSPNVTLTAPANGTTTASSSMAVGGTAGTEEGDSTSVVVQLFAGSSVAGGQLEAVTVQSAGGQWGTTLGGLAPGTYTVRAQQHDDVGNTGYSSSATFTVTAPPPGPTPSGPSPPIASFKWFPSVPRVGESVSLVSTSTEAGSALTGFAWSLTASGPLIPGSSVLATTFTTAGNHVVRLSVAAANGLSSTVSETIPVRSRPVVLLQPFPVVRIAGSESRSGVRISLFTVLAPRGASVTVSCRGRSCPAKVQHLVAASRRGTKRGTVLVTLRRFQRSLRAGTVLEIRISKPGQIGKYTRFSVRRGKLPLRVDSCLGPAGIKPIACPSS